MAMMMTNVAAMNEHAYSEKPLKIDWFSEIPKILEADFDANKRNI